MIAIFKIYEQHFISTLKTILIHNAYFLETMNFFKYDKHL